MKEIHLFVLAFLVLLLAPNFSNAQSAVEWEGRWELISTKSSFCNIHIVTDLLPNQPEPTAVLEGLINGEPFRINCTVKEIPERNSVVFHEAPAADGSYKYKKGEPLFLLIVTRPENPLIVTPVWMQLDITELRTNKDCIVRRVPTPRYKGLYKFDYNGTQTSLAIGRVQKTKFTSTVEKNGGKVDCDCELQARHLAVCYPENGKGAFFLDFNEEGVKVVKSYDQNIYKPGASATEDSELVWNTTLKK
jgi:hypothetical protein